MDEKNIIVDILILGGITLPCLVAWWKSIMQQRAYDRQLNNTDFTGSILQTSDIPYLSTNQLTIESFYNQNLEGTFSVATTYLSRLRILHG